VGKLERRLAPTEKYIGESLSDSEAILLKTLPWPEPQARADEIVSAYRAWDAECEAIERAVGYDRTDDVSDAPSARPGRDPRRAGRDAGRRDRARRHRCSKFQALDAGQREFGFRRVQKNPTTAPRIAPGMPSPMYSAIPSTLDCGS